MVVLLAVFFGIIFESNTVPMGYLSLARILPMKY